MKKFCSVCGKEFNARNYRICRCPECVSAVDTCPICGKSKSVWKTACCRSCATKLQLQKFDVLNSPKSIEKRKHTCMERYGSPSNLWGRNKDKTLERNQARYGGNSPFSSPDVQLKSQETCMARYGVKFGGGSKQAQDKLRDSMLTRYGVPNSHYMHMKNISDLNKEFVESHFLDSNCHLKYDEIMEYFGFSGPAHIRRAFSRLGVKFIRNFQKQQSELEDFIVSLGFSICRNTRTVIPPKELDIFIPSKMVAFEYNGIYWHSDEVLLKKVGMTSRQFNQQKFDMCTDRGIALYFITESEWMQHRDSVKAHIVEILL